MSSFDTKKLPPVEDVIAPDGLGIRVLLPLRGGSMARSRSSYGLPAVTAQHIELASISQEVIGRSCCRPKARCAAGFCSRL
jgi:hypothetical protein